MAAGNWVRMESRVDLLVSGFMSRRVMWVFVVVDSEAKCVVRAWPMPEAPPVVLGIVLGDAGRRGGGGG